jgi:3-hydroxyacyl-CoA dehydrogenase / enoyl-CoA hydratase / 3-hydroxybutyryl-CoA epimerase
MTTAITVEVGPDGIAVVTWQTARLDARTIRDFAEIIDHLVADDRIKGAIFTGRDGCFAPALDIEWLLQATAPGPDSGDLNRAVSLLNSALRKIEGADCPFVAAINGDACGAGYELALACRRRIAASGAGIQIGLTDLRLGLPPAAGGVCRLARLVGGVAAQALLLAAQPLAPAQALQRGLINGSLDRGHRTARPVR